MSDLPGSRTDTVPLNTFYVLPVENQSDVETEVETELGAAKSDSPNGVATSSSSDLKLPTHSHNYCEAGRDLVQTRIGSFFSQTPVINSSGDTISSSQPKWQRRGKASGILKPLRSRKLLKRKGGGSTSASQVDPLLSLCGMDGGNIPHTYTTCKKLTPPMVECSCYIPKAAALTCLLRPRVREGNWIKVSRSCEQSEKYIGRHNSHLINNRKS